MLNFFQIYSPDIFLHFNRRIWWPGISKAYFF